MKQVVRITLEMDSHFLRLLWANVQMSNLVGSEAVGRQLSPAQVLAVLVCTEGRGAPEEQILAMTPSEWHPHVRAIHEERRVIETDDAPQ